MLASPFRVWMTFSRVFVIDEEVYQELFHSRQTLVCLYTRVLLLQQLLKLFRNSVACERTFVFGGRFPACLLVRSDTSLAQLPHLKRRLKGVAFLGFDSWLFDDIDEVVAVKMWLHICSLVKR